jgi:simple sugar transport system permease protein
VDIVTASIIFFVGVRYLILLIQKRIKDMDEKAALEAANKKAAKANQQKGGE